MGTTTYPVPSSGSSTSTVLPVNASSVLLDGALTSATSYTTTINGNGGIAYLVAGDNPANFTVGGNFYTVPANTVSATTTAVGSSSSVTVSNGGYVQTAPASFTASTMPSSTQWYGVAYGAGTFVAVGGNANTAGAYSTNGSTWTANTMPNEIGRAHV